MTVEELMRRASIPGLAVALLKDGELRGMRILGLGDATTGEPITDESVFQAGSISKPVAAMCVLVLASNGDIDLDLDIATFLRSWRISPAGNWRPAISTRQLLSHTAGLTVHGFPGYHRERSLPSLIDILDGSPPANTPPIRIRIAPGTQYSYSGGGYCVVQQIVEDVTGDDFSDVVREAIFKPLGMVNSVYLEPSLSEMSGVPVSGHRVGGIPVDGGWHVYPEKAAAGLWTTAGDLARFLGGIERARRGSSEAIVPAPLVESALTSHAPNQRYGLGLRLGNPVDGHAYGHGGDTQGFVSKAVYYPRVSSGAIVMTNSDRGQIAIDAVCDSLALALEWPTKPPTGNITNPAAARSCLGTYESGTGLRMRVAEGRSGSLSLVIDGLPPLRVLMVDATTWYSPDIDLRIRFEGTTATLCQDAPYVQAITLTRLD